MAPIPRASNGSAPWNSLRDEADSREVPESRGGGFSHCARLLPHHPHGLIKHPSPLTAH